MTILLIILILCHLTNITCNLLRTSSIAEIILPAVGTICAGLAFIPSIFVWGFSLSFICYALMFFFNTIRYGQAKLKPKTVLQYIVYGASGLGVLASLIGGTIWSCI
jgi:hypothetical protein